MYAKRLITFRDVEKVTERWAWILAEPEGRPEGVRNVSSLDLHHSDRGFPSGHRRVNVIENLLLFWRNAFAQSNFNIGPLCVVKLRRTNAKACTFVTSLKVIKHPCNLAAFEINDRLHLG